MWHWRLTDWCRRLTDGRLMEQLDARWRTWSVKMLSWPKEHPRLEVASEIPLSTWLRHPLEGWKSYRVHRR